MYDVTKLLRKSHFSKLLKLLPTPKQKRRGRKRVKKKTLNLDMLYMNLSFRREMRKKGIRVNMKVRKQDFTRKIGSKLKLDWEKYKARFLLERTNGWLKNFRRLMSFWGVHPWGGFVATPAELGDWEFLAEGFDFFGNC